MEKLLSGYRFLFYFENTLKAGFQKISGINRSIEIEYLREGGRNDFAIPIQGTSSSGGKLVFEKGAGIVNPFFDLSGCTPGKRITKPCSIFILNEMADIKRVLTFDNGVIVSWECSDLDATSSEILIDKVEIEHTGIYETH